MNSINHMLIYTLPLETISTYLLGTSRESCPRIAAILMAGNQTANCSHFTLDERVLIGTAGGIAATISTICCLFTLTLILVFKKYVFSTQQLVLYLIISVFLYSIARIIMDGSATILFKNQQLCIGLAFCCQYMASCILVSVWCILFELYVRSVSARDIGKLKWIYPFVIFLLPALVTSIPLFTGSYGPTRANCLIQDFNPINCTRNTLGLVLHAVIWWVPTYLTIMTGAVGYIIAVMCLTRESHKYSALINPRWRDIPERIKQDLKYLRWYPPLFMLIELAPIANGIYDFVVPDKPILELWVLAHIITGLMGGFLAIIFTLDPYTRRRLTRSQLRAACLYNICRKEVVEEYPTLVSHSDSLKVEGNEGQ